MVGSNCSNPSRRQRSVAWTRLIIGKEKHELIQELLKRLSQRDLTADQIRGGKGKGISKSHYSRHLTEGSGPDVCAQHSTDLIHLILHMEHAGYASNIKTSQLALLLLCSDYRGWPLQSLLSR